MIDNLVIVESPAKAKTIEKFLGKDYRVESSMGHIRDLSKKNLGIDIKNNFKPEYIVPDDKKKIVSELKKLAKGSKTIWLASDEDREGEAIAWHLCEELKLKPENTRRIVFSEITKDAIIDSIKNYRTIDQSLVNAQQARRVLDRLVGFELSPVLWKKVKPALSAGRVQSVAVRLIVEREREIINFKSSSSFRVTATFLVHDDSGKSYPLKADASKRFDSEKDAMEFLKKCENASFIIKDIVTKPTKKSPSPPFTTSTLQQEASRKLGFSVSQTMTIAQKLYEAGFITYMRTDSFNLSQTALGSAKDIISEDFGEPYLHIHHYKTKSKSAQEAHEAIRPTYLNKKTISASNNENRLYELIWKRTIASQMSDAQFEKTQVSINVSASDIDFLAQGEVMKFDGFLKVYIESKDDESEDEAKGLLPPVSLNQELRFDEIIAMEKFQNYPPRYTEASLVKKLEDLGIGRPSTYAPTISTIQNRGYVVKEDRMGTERKFRSIILNHSGIKRNIGTEMAGKEKTKLFPTDIGMIVNDFLIEYFNEILDYNFTAKVEKEFDDIAEGNIEWTTMISSFYKSFHENVETTLEVSGYSKGERHLGTEPESGKPVFVRMGRYGPIVQIGEADKESSEKPKFASLMKGQHLETISLEEALELFKLPREIGNFEGKEMVVGIGRFGPYVRHDSKFYSLKRGVDDPYKITAERAIEIIDEKREAEKNKTIKTFEEDKELLILNGRWGPYISYRKKNYKIPKNIEPKELSLTECMEIIKTSEEKKNTKK